MDVQEVFRARELRRPFGVHIALVGPDRYLFGMQQLVLDLAILHPGGGGLQTVHEAIAGIDARIHLHAEIPVATLLG